MAKQQQRALNLDLFHSGKYRQRVERNKKKDYQRQPKHRNRHLDGGYFLPGFFYRRTGALVVCN